MLRYLRFTIVLTVLVVSTSAYGAQGGFCDRMLQRVRSFFRRGQATQVEVVAATAAADAAHYVPDLAENYMERRAKGWITQQKCLSCHTVLPYTITHFSGAGADAEGMNEIRQYIVGRVDNWEAAQPWYDGAKASESKGSELIISSFFLTQAKETGAGAEERVLKALRLMSEMQDADGAFPWLDYNLEPFESKEARTYGASLAAISYGQLSPHQQAEFAPEIEKLRGYLRKVWEKDSVTPIDQLHVAWADSQLGGIINKTELKQAIKEIGTKQDADGGWSINQLSKWKKKGVSTPAQTDTSDAYATAYVLFVMKQSGLKDDSGFSSSYIDGVDWLKAHQNSTGSWDQLSLNSTAPMNNQLATDYASGFAWAVLKGH